MVASLLGHKRRTTRRFIAQRAFGTMCVAFAHTKGQTPANLKGRPLWASIEEGDGCVRHFQGAPWRD